MRRQVLGFGPKTGAKTKKPFHFQPKATPFAFGGVYDVWKGDGGMPILPPAPTPL